MANQRGLGAGILLALLSGGLVLLMHSASGENPNAQPRQRPRDAIADAQTSKEVPAERPEQKKTTHDLSDVFSPSKATPTTRALAKQTDQGQFLGFDLYKDPVGAMKPGMTFDEVYKALVAAKPKVMETQQKLLVGCYNLEPRPDSVAKMSRGKPWSWGRPSGCPRE